ncbi:MAG: regulatory protein RecX [Myxococcota bacterium]
MRSDESSGRRPRRRTPRPLERGRLERAALYYVERHAPSRAQLERYLTQKVARERRAQGESAPPKETTDEWIEAIIGRFERYGYVDDARYAASKARTMRSRGDSARKIRARLAEKGVRGGVVEDGLAEAGVDDRSAAARLARRRRLGPFRRTPLPDDWEARQKEQKRELGVLGRAGFPYGLAREVLDAERDEAEEWAG